MTKRIDDLVQQHATGALEAHDLRIRQAGPANFLEFRLVVPGEMTVAAAHEICDRIEVALKQFFFEKKNQKTSLTLVPGFWNAKLLN